MAAVAEAFRAHSRQVARATDWPWTVRTATVSAARTGADLKTWWHDYVEMLRVRMLNRAS